MIRFTHLLVLAVLMASTSVAHAGFNNGGFDSDLNGWSKEGSTASSIAQFLLFTQADGKLAKLVPDGGLTSNIGDLQTALGLNTATIGSLVDNPFNGVAIYQTVSVNAGDKISFDYYFVRDDTNDGAFVTIGDTIQGLNTANNSVSFESTFASSGSFTIGVGVVNGAGSGDISSALYVDNFLITSNSNSGGNNNTAVVPEPASITLLGLAGIAGGVYGWRRRRQAAA